MAKKSKVITVGDLNRMEMWSVLTTDFNCSIRRIPGGFAYEYESGAVVFVSTDEFRNE